ncbi:MAG: hypothetical protein IJE48_06280 [Clostridia bacterium]|nr:hypothetical protein [Clostridia bacterium]
MLDFLEHAFITFFNMSITGSYIILAIIFIRFLLRKAPKIFSYCLWIIAGLRLLCPFSISSVLSIFNFLSVPAHESSIGGATVNGYVPDNIGTMKIPEISTGINAADAAINPALPAPQIGESVNPMQVITSAAAVLWVIGIAAMAAYGLASLVSVYRRTGFATRLEGNIFECDKIRSPFVFGFFRPKIFLPCGMDDKQKKFVILHEKNHIRRLDHITKLLSFAVLMLHWYNPLVWLGYHLMVRDMEMSCDEKVLRELGEEEKKNYGLTLVAVGSNRRFAAGAPLSFGENVVEKRIVNVLNFKKPKTVAIIICVVLCIAVGAVCLTNSVNKTYSKEDVREKVEIFLEEDWKKQTEGNEHYKYEMRIAAAEVVEISEDKMTAYGWQRIYDYNSSYYQLLRYEDALFQTDEMPAVGFKAELDEKGNVVSVINYENDKDIPESVRQKGRYDNEIFERAQNKARGKYKEYLSLVKTYETEYSYAADESINAVKITGCELVTDQFGKPCLVIRAKNTAEGGAYYLLDDFVLLNGKTGEAYDPKHPATQFETTIPSGYLVGTEVLHFADLSMYIDEISEPSYVLKLIVSDNDGIHKEIMLEIKVGKATSKKPQLAHKTLSYGTLIPVTEKIRGAVSGVIYPGMNYNNFINLSAEELEEIVRCFNKTKFTKVREAYIDYSKSIYVVIDASDNRKYQFTVSSGGMIEDVRGDFYESSTMELYKLVHDITDAHGVVFQPDRPDISGESVGYTAETTALDIIRPNYFTTEAMTGVMTLNPPYQPPATTAAESSFEPTRYQKYVVTDVESDISENSGLEFKGLDILTGEYVSVTFVNDGDRILYIVPNQALRRYTSENTTERMMITSSYEPRTELVPVYPNQLITVDFPFDPYFSADESRNGRYALITGAYYGTESGADENSIIDVRISFSVESRTVGKARPGEKLENPDMINAEPNTSGVIVTRTLSEDEKSRFVKLYNGFDWSNPVDGEQHSENCFVARVIDGNKMIYLFVYDDGTVEMNSSQRYDVGAAGRAMYELLSTSW